ncbi:hypothetical protein CRM22_006676 [Opisthorchis felineus]|uniref:Uncharacterized protein n=1 Tax=Opisthorchis felineus TaxID=147828 RepID=A0A4S2LK21_OPIFE|nr:hypothetical protein CRM22_006676 [Opisthorchis felineus]
MPNNRLVAVMGSQIRRFPTFSDLDDIFLAFFRVIYQTNCRRMSFFSLCHILFFFVHDNVIVFNHVFPGIQYTPVIYHTENSLEANGLILASSPCCDLKT